MMTRPAYGFSAPIVFVRARDGDTIEVRLPGSAFIFAVRLIDTWCPELRSGPLEMRQLAVRGKNWVHAKLSKLNPDSLSIYIPLPETNQPLKSLTFDRIPAWIFIDQIHTLNEAVVKEGFAASVKGGPLGE